MDYKSNYEFRTNYERLGIARDATYDEIEAGYQNALLLNQDVIAARDQKGTVLWALIESAHKTLSDPTTRAAYDKKLDEQEKRANPSAPSPTPSNEDLLRNVKTPVINWDAMEWFNRDYSGIREAIKAKQPGLRKGIFGIMNAFLAVFLIAMYAGTYELDWAKGFPVNMFFAIVAIVAWFKYYNYKWGKKRYFTAFGIFTAFSVYSILEGEHEGSSVIIAVIVGIVCLLVARLGISSAENFRRWAGINSSRRIIRRRLSAKEIKNTTTWGTAGNLDDALETFGAQAVALGSAGEKFTAEFMQQLLKIPGTRIFHGLQFPGSDNADVDHAIVNGDKIVFVDSKMWKAGNYRWGWDAIIERHDENGRTDINSNFHFAVAQYARRLPEAQIRSRILIYSASGRPVIVDNSNAQHSGSRNAPSTEMIAAQEFYEEVGAWFSEGKPGYINKHLLSALYSNLQF